MSLGPTQLFIFETAVNGFVTWQMVFKRSYRHVIFLFSKPKLTLTTTKVIMKIESLVFVHTVDQGSATFLNLRATFEAQNQLSIPACQQLKTKKKIFAPANTNIPLKSETMTKIKNKTKKWSPPPIFRCFLNRRLWKRIKTHPVKLLFRKCAACQYFSFCMP